MRRFVSFIRSVCLELNAKYVLHWAITNQNKIKRVDFNVDCQYQPLMKLMNLFRK